jgi:2-phospho-L-lactate guanylyltransferase
MFRGVVAAALASGSVKVVAVVSPDPAALDLAATLDPAVIPVPQSPETPGLNAAIAEGVGFAARHGAAAALILFGDLPLLTGDDVRNLVRRDSPVVLAPDRHGTGTNALILRLSRRPRQLRQARRRGPPARSRRGNLALGRYRARSRYAG